MKIKYFLSCLLLLLFISGNAQLRYGFRLGGDFASASLKGAEGYSLNNRSGFSGGLMLEYQFQQCGFAPDIAVLYGRHNTRLEAGEGKPVSFGRNFIDIPLHLKYKFWLRSFSNLFAPMIYTGPVASFKLDHSGSVPLDTKTFQPGWDIGIGFDIINFIQITGGYRFGIGNAVKEFQGFRDARLLTDGWNLSVNLLFDF